MVALTNASRRGSVWLLALFGVIPFGQATRKPSVYAAPALTPWSLLAP